MNIVPAEARHADEILRLLVQVNNVHSALRPDLFLPDKTKYTKPELLQILGDPEKPIFAAEEGTRVLGYAFCQLQSHKEDNNWPDIVTCYVDDICVDETARGQGVAAALFAHVKAWAKNAGCYNLTLNVWENNTPARRFYESMGLGIQKTGMETVL